MNIGAGADPVAMDGNSLTSACLGIGSRHESPASALRAA